MAIPFRPPTHPARSMHWSRHGSGRFGDTTQGGTWKVQRLGRRFCSEVGGADLLSGALVPKRLTCVKFAVSELPGGAWNNAKNCILAGGLVQTTTAIATHRIPREIRSE